MGYERNVKKKVFPNYYFISIEFLNRTANNL